MQMTKKQLLAIDNVAILMKAQERGLKIHPEDLRLNYAEMDLALNALEDTWIQAATTIMTKRFSKWLSTVEKKEDLDPGKMNLGLQLLFLDYIQSVWNYGQRTADDEALELEAIFAERSGGNPSTDDLTNTDAFEWYDLYTRELARQAQDAAFTYMQPLILEKLEAGVVRLQLSAALETDFKRYGEVRTGIIARTESNKAFNWGRRYRFDKSPAIAGYRYSAILDERTTEICQYLHGHSWEITDPGLDENTPPNHYQCRSVIVPINRYRSFTFDPPAAGWEAGLPDKERTVYEKFKDSTFYPKAQTVISKNIPKFDPPVKKAVPKKGNKQQKNANTIKNMSHLVLSAEDVEAIEKFDKIIQGIDFTKDRRKISKDLLARVGLDHVKVSVRKIKALGQVQYYDEKTGMAVDSFVLDSQDGRDDIHKLRTMFHEFYHANYHGLIHDYQRYGGFSREEWKKWEETATEAAAHFMLQRAGVGSGTVPSYSSYLTKTLPLLKHLPEFADCVSVEDFGAKFMKYRFSKNKSAKWKEFQESVAEIEIEWEKYYRENYEQYVMDNEDQIVDEIFAAISTMGKERNREAYQSGIRNGIRDGWKKMRNTWGDVWTMSMIMAMEREGIK